MFDPRRWLVCSLMFAAAVLQSGPTASAEKWTDVRGQKTINARMLGLWGDAVVLELPTGRRVAVPLSSLQGSSRIQAQKVARELSQTRQSQIDELKRARDQLVAPAPTPLPQPTAPPAPPYPRGEGLQAALDWEQSVAKTGRVKPFWNLLSSAQQQKVAGAVAKQITDTGIDDVKQLATSLHAAATAVYTKQNWFLSHPRFADLPEPQESFLRQNVIPVAGIMFHLFDPSAFDPATLAEGNLQPMMDHFDQKVAPHIHEMLKTSDAAVGKWVAETGPDQTHFKVLGDAGLGIKVEMVQRDGVWFTKTFEQELDKWIPSDDGESSAADAASGNASGQSGLGAMAMSGLPIPPSVVASMINASVQPLADANNARDYHLAMEQLIAKAQPMLQFAGGLPGGLKSGGFMSGDSMSDKRMQDGREAGRTESMLFDELQDF